MNRNKRRLRGLLSAAAACFLLSGGLAGPDQALAAGTSGIRALAPEDFHEASIMESDPAFSEEGAVIVYMNQTNSEPVWTLHSEDFRMEEWGGRQRMVTDLSLLSTDAFRTWEDPARVSFAGAGYTSEGRSVDVTYFLDRISLKAGPHTESEGKNVVQAAFTGEGELFLSGFAFKGLEAGGIYAEDSVTMEVTYSDTGEPVENMVSLQCFKDIDVVSGSLPGAVEAIRFDQGYSGRSYVMEGTWLSTSDGTWFRATRATDEAAEEVLYSTVYSVVSGPSCSFSWTGGNCATSITTLSGGSYPPVREEFPVKTADRETAGPGDRVTYEIRMDFPYTDPDSAAASIEVYDDLDPALDSERAEGTVTRQGEDDTGSWNFRVREGRVSFTAADPALVRGEDYVFRIRVPLAEGILDGHGLTLRDGVLYAKIPNASGFCIADHNGVIQERTGKPVTVLTPAAGLSLTKTADREAISGAMPGDRIRYSFVIRNTGRVTLTDTALTDALPVRDLKTDWASSTDPETAAGTLSPGESVTASAVYVLTQADIDRGLVHNQAEAIGRAPDGSPVRASDEADTSLDARPSISLSKAADPEKIVRAEPGDVINYTFSIRNSGSVTLTDISLTDSLEGLEGPSLDWSGVKKEGVLLPGESLTGTASWQVRQADIDAGRVLNRAEVTGTDPEGETVKDADEALTLLTGTPALRFSKEAEEPVMKGAAAGDEAVFLFRAENTGTVTLTGLSIRDSLEGLSDPVCSWPGQAGVLLPGQVMTARAVYRLTQADIDEERIIYNTAVMTAGAPDGETLEEEDDAEVRVFEDPAIHLVKEADPVSIEDAAAGDLVTYTFTGTNTGTVTLKGVVLEDDLEGLQDLALAWEGEEGVLLPGQRVTASASYALTQEDIDRGEVINTARIRGTSEAGTTVEHDGDAQTLLNGHDSMTLVKEADCASLPEAAPGDRVTFTFTAANTGTRTLHGVRIQDDLEGLSDLAMTWPGEAGTLMPGQTMTASAVYTIDQSDIDRGSLYNLAVLHGTGPDGDPLPPEEDEAEVVLPETPRIELTKEADPVLLDPAEAGRTIRYRFVLTNTGNVTLTGVSVTDDLKADGDLADFSMDWSGAGGGEGTLLPGETVEGTASYTITQADIDRGSVANGALAEGTSPSGEKVTDRDETVTELAGTADLSLTKTADPVLIRDAQAGSAVTYTIEAVNTGSVTLTGVTLTDSLEGLDYFETDWSEASQEGTLLPGERVRAEASYSLTQADIDRGSLVNTVLVSAKGPDPEAPVLEREDTVKTDLPSTPLIQLTKTVDMEEIAGAEPGRELTYFFAIENISGVTLSEVALEDELEGLSEIVPDPGMEALPVTLSPGQVWTGTASYALTRADIDRGEVLNHALASGRGPGTTDPETGEEKEGETVTDTDEARTILDGEASVSMVKKADPSSMVDAKAGDTITYSFTVTNTGSVTLTGLVISDGLKGLGTPVFDWDGSTDPETGAGILAPGESVTARALYALTSADLSRGRVVNSALVKAQTPQGDPVESETVTARTSLKKTPRTALGRVFKNPRTGDWNLAALWAALGLAGLSAAGVLQLLKRRKG